MTDCAPAELILAGALRAVARRDRDETSARVALSGTPSACSAAGGSSVATRRFLRRQLGLVGFRRSGERHAFHAPSGLGLRGRIERLQAAFSATWREIPRHVSRR